MASNGDHCSCENCGRIIGVYGPNMTGEIRPPRNAVIARKGIFLHTFCCDRCKNEWKTVNKSTVSTLYSDPGPEELSPEQIRAKAEADEVLARVAAEEKRIQNEIEKAELDADRAKARELKAEGKKWLALWTAAGKNGRYGIGFGIAIAWLVGFGMPLLLPFAILGTVFAGLVIKDSMKK